MLNKTILVTGATGHQGGAVVKHLIPRGFNVIALTRNAGSEKARRLIQPNVQVVSANLSAPETYRPYLKDVYGVFSVQALEKNNSTEVQQGVNLANEAKAANVQHFIYSSAIGADSQAGVPHFDTKLQIENHVKQLGIPYTILRPTSFYENFLMPQVKKGIEKGNLVQPIKKHTVWQYIATDDIGKVVADAFANPTQFTGRTITLAGMQENLEAIAQIFSSVLNKPVKYKHLPRLITRLFLGKDLYKMFAWIDEEHYSPADYEQCKKEFPYLTPFADWVRQHFTS